MRDSNALPHRAALSAPLSSLAVITALCAAPMTASAAPQTVTAVFDIEAQGLRLKKATITGLSDFLAASLASTGEHQVVPRDELEKRLREQKAASYEQCYDESCQIEIGKELAADHALATKIVKLGGQCVVTMKLFELRRSTTAWAATARGGCSETELLGSLERALASRAVNKPEEKTSRAPEPEKPAPKAAAAPDGRCARYGKHGLSGRGDLRALPVITSAIPIVEKSYFEPSRVDYRGMLHAALTEVGSCVSDVSFEDRGEPALVIRGEKLPVSIDSANSSWKLQSELRRALAWVGSNLPAGADHRMIEYAALSGALAILDTHTMLITPREYGDLKTSTSGSFAGVGMVLSVREGKLTVLSTIEGSPAHREELQAGDIILAIEGTPFEDITLDDAVRLLRGNPGTHVRISVERAGKKLDKSLKREMIKVPATRHERLPGGIGYIRVHNFNINAAAEVQAAKSALGAVDGLIIDLRNNPGGYLAQVVTVADQFLASGLIVATTGGKNAVREDRNATPAGTDTNMPIAILTDGGTASGAEIVAGTLKLNDRAVMIGKPTFGKGTVQQLYELPDGSALKLTTAQYVVTGDHKFADRGFTPDILLKETKIADKTSDDAVIALAARLLRAAPHSSRTRIMDAARKLPRDPLIERFE